MIRKLFSKIVKAYKMFFPEKKPLSEVKLCPSTCPHQCPREASEYSRFRAKLNEGRKLREAIRECREYGIDPPEFLQLEEAEVTAWLWYYDRNKKAEE